MNKDQEILAVGRLAFELTRLGSTTTDLDHLLENLHPLLNSITGIRVLPQSAILLYSPHGYLLQVAQHGLTAPWDTSAPPPTLPPSTPGEHTQARQRPWVEHALCISLDAIDEQTPCFVLPLHNETRIIGHVVLLTDPEWQADPFEIEFMTDLSRTLSILVSRCLLTETLMVREVELENARSEAIRRLGAASEFRDNETGMHIMRMTNYATSIAKFLGLPASQREMLAICAPMHDVGKIGIPDAILRKPGKLSADEYEIMKTHTEIGRRLLSGDDELLAAAREIAGSHHERWDGTGYPQGLAGEAIPLLARICTVADVFDALTSVRPYKQRWSFQDTSNYIQEQSGKHFDPTVVAAFIKALPEIARIRELYRDDIIDPKRVLQLPPLTEVRESNWVIWDESLSIGIDVIDEHHRYLFELTNELYDVVKKKRSIREVARIIKALDHYAQIHFRAEERMMAYYGYERFEHQQYQHKRFEERLRDFYEQLHDNPMTARYDTLVHLRSWLVHHIRIEDSQLKELVHL